ncbi:hypothetical protein [Pseudomonas putida]|uniref:Uncharacterized protein n=1 Tax=Pseudomonas putida TaxID=303 RepID=A0A2S3WFL5_PSEPU|nr:hypothetical protein [Pseudomonas putida]POF89681.1 hypothetical protein BGP80_17610 [Pseudomonas putida]
MSDNQMISVPREWLNSVALLQMPLDELQDQATEFLAEQHQGEPVARVEVGADRNACVTITDNDWLRELKDKAAHQIVPLYAHADPAEVERLRAVIEQQKNLIESLRADLVESLSIDASAEPSAPGDGVKDERDYAIEHAGYLADAADQVLADYQAYSLAQMLENEGGDDGDGEHAEAVDSARDELHDGLANLRSMTYEFRKRRPRSNPTQL